MNRILCVVVSVLALSSCVNSYNIKGTSNVSMLDGQNLFLKVNKQNDLRKLDSCEVIHGQFAFSGTLDSVRMGYLYVDNNYVQVLVLEPGDISIRIDVTQPLVGGTVLNDKLNRFNSRLEQIQGQLDELAHEEYLGIADNKDMNVVYTDLVNREAKLNMEADSLLTHFIEDNFNNVLGPWAFMLHASKYEFPMLDPFIEAIMSKATETFKNDPFIKDYYEKAQENQQIMNGLKDVPVQTTVPSVAPPPAVPAPTPNELAAPAGD